MNQVTRTEAAPPAVTERPSTGSLLNFIEMAVTNPAIDVEKMKALLAMQREVISDEAKIIFNEALARVSADMPRVKKNGRVDLGTGKGGYDFTTWPDMDTAIRPLMQREGFTLSFDMQAKEGGGAVVSGTLLHIKGHSRTVTVPLSLDSGAGRNNLQAMGSTLSYGKRYCAEMLFNIVREGTDDDGKLGGTVFITAVQVEEINRLIDGNNVPRDAFLEWVGAVRVENIQAEDFARVKGSLVKRAQKGGRT